MRAVLAIVLAFMAGSFMATTASKIQNYPRFFKHRTKLREIRGFKPEYISTAIGFGKREGPIDIQDLNGRERILLSLLKNLPYDVPTEVLLRTMQTNPILANRLTQLSMQNDQSNKELIMEYPNPARTLALF